MTARTLTMSILVTGIAGAGVGFSIKMVEFADDLTARSGIAFAGAPLFFYAIVAVGFIALLSFSFLKGHFRDVEEPKFDLLEKERQRDESQFGRP
jgi:hypothetical protein